MFRPSRSDSVVSDEHFLKAAHRLVTDLIALPKPGINVRDVQLSKI